MTPPNDPPIHQLWLRICKDLRAQIKWPHVHTVPTHVLRIGKEKPQLPSCPLTWNPPKGPLKAKWSSRTPQSGSMSDRRYKKDTPYPSRLFPLAALLGVPRSQLKASCLCNHGQLAGTTNMFITCFTCNRIESWLYPCSSGDPRSSPDSRHRVPSTNFSLGNPKLSCHTR